MFDFTNLSMLAIFFGKLYLNDFDGKHLTVTGIIPTLCPLLYPTFMGFRPTYSGKCLRYTIK
jgi:hypothetical protein